MIKVFLSSVFLVIKKFLIFNYNIDRSLNRNIKYTLENHYFVMKISNVEVAVMVNIYN